MNPSRWPLLWVLVGLLLADARGLRAETPASENGLGNTRWENSSGNIRFYADGSFRYNVGCSSFLGRWKLERDGRVAATYGILDEVGGSEKQPQIHGTMELQVSEDGKALFGSLGKPWKRSAEPSEADALQLAASYLRLRFPEKPTSSYRSEVRYDSEMEKWVITYSPSLDGHKPNRSFRITIDRRTSDLTFFESI